MMFSNLNLKELFKNEKVIIYSLTIILVATIGLISYVGYNEYIYRKIGVCFTQANYGLAEYYAESISPSYKDVEKIKSFIHTIKNFDETNINDYKRTLSLLDSYKGFSNVNINYFYNSYYHRVFGITNSLTQQHNQTPTAATTATQSENTSSITFPYENTTSQTSDSAANAQTYATTTNQQNTDSIIVFYVESGEVYHINSNCRSLSNSSNVLSGPIPDGRRACKICAEG